MDHRLAIEVARALGQRRCFARYAGQPTLAAPELPQAQETAGPATGEVSVGMFTGLARRTANARAVSQVGVVVYAAAQSGACYAVDKCGLITAWRHEVPDSSSRRCAFCIKCA